ncbi:PRC-barrel domain-containing protein [Variovorax sp. H27-G14]|uniref:PRC-barrel domain-containing protein n=1 Tax=Variovorax sp. H27-G14 TaxID=3111914 RepID=UPI0038FC1062
MIRTFGGNTLAAAVLGIALWGSASPAALAQVAGSTVLGITTTESSRAAIGWSARESILGRDVYNETGEKLGKVEDLIVDRVRNVSFLIIEVGGIAGMERHAVAIPAVQVQLVGDRMVLSGVTREVMAGLPPFIYAPITRSQSSIVDRAERDIDKARQQLAQLQSLARPEAGLELAVDDVREKIDAMNTAEDGSWKAAEREVRVADTRLRKVMKSLSR